MRPRDSENHCDITRHLPKKSVALRIVVLAALSFVLFWTSIDIQTFGGTTNIIPTIVYNRTIQFSTTATTTTNNIPPSCQSMLSRTSNLATSIFRPVHFFQQGPGKVFLAQAMQTKKDLQLKSRFFVFEPRNTTLCPFAYYHIHKNGGGTISKHVPLPMIQFNSDAERTMGTDNYTNATNAYMQTMFLQQQQQFTTSPFLFTFLRNPLDRFLSSLGQVLNGPRGLIRQRLAPCHNAMTTHDLIQCTLSKMESNVSFLDDHLVPQSFELYIGLDQNDLNVHVMNMSDISTIVRLLGGHDKRENSAVGVVANYPQFQLVPSVLTSDFRRRICHLYRADVLMLQQTNNITHTACSEMLL